MIDQNCIIVCEPQCVGFEHSPVNAAYLETLLMAYPEYAIVFMAEARHLEWVRGNLGPQGKTNRERITWQEIRIPPRQSVGWSRMLAELLWCRLVLGIARREKTHFVFLCSITATGLLALKCLLWASTQVPPIIAVIHGVLATILLRQPRRPWNWLLDLRQVLLLPHPRRLKLIAPGESIYLHLSKSMPSVARHFRPLEHPYIWAQARCQEAKRKDPQVRFGYFGVGFKGFDAFHRLAAEISENFSSAEFWLVGFLDHQFVRSVYSDPVKGIGNTPLSLEEYGRRANMLDYAIWIGSPEHYRLTASGSFLDALSYLKPGIYLRNPYVEHYFKKMGDIGYLCGSISEMRDVILAIVADLPRTRYRQQRENIFRGRTLFEPFTLASQLRAIGDECSYWQRSAR